MKKKKFLKFLIPLALISLFSVTCLASTNSDAFREVFEQAKSADGNKIIASIVDALYFGLLYIFRGVARRITIIASGFMLILLALDSLKTILGSLNRIDYAAIMKRLMPNFLKGFLIFTFLVAPVSHVNTLGVAVQGKSNDSTPFTNLVELLFGAFYKLGLKFFSDGDIASGNLTPGQMADVFFTTPFEMLKNCFNTWTILAVFLNIIKILIIIFCLWMAGKIIATLISNIFSGLLLSVFAIFFLIFLLFEPTKSMAQRGINTIVSQVITVFMTVGMVGLSFQVMKMISTAKSTDVPTLVTLAILLMMMQRTTENTTVMANSLVNGAGLGASNTQSFMTLLGAMGSIVGGGLMLTSEVGDNMVNDFKNGMDKSEADTFFGKIADGGKNIVVNSAPVKVAKDIKAGVGRTVSKASAIDQMVSKGMKLSEARKNAKTLGEAQKALRNAEKNLENLERKKYGIGAGGVGAILGNLGIAAMTGNMNNNNVLGAISERIGNSNKNATEQQIRDAQEKVAKAAANVKVIENLTGAKVSGTHNNFDFEALKKSGDTNSANRIQELQDRVERAAAGKMSNEELQKIIKEVQSDSKFTSNTNIQKATEDINKGAHEISNFVVGPTSMGTASTNKDDAKNGKDEAKVNQGMPDSSGPNRRFDPNEYKKAKDTFNATENKGTEGRQEKKTYSDVYQNWSNPNQTGNSGNNSNNSGSSSNGGSNSNNPGNYGSNSRKDTTTPNAFPNENEYKNPNSKKNKE